MIKLLLRLTENRPIRFIDVDGEPYLQRYYMGKLFGATFYLHRFINADVKEHTHNHPWSWGFALVIRGSYLERVVLDLCPWASSCGADVKLRLVRWFNWIPPYKFHNVVSAKPETWTLLVHGERARLATGELKGWGFLEQATGVGGPYTLFKPVISAYGWWLNAPLAKDVER